MFEFEDLRIPCWIPAYAGMTELAVEKVQEGITVGKSK
jgi:hypothetical protein